MHFLITGHNGFKGAWLTLLLVERGHKVSGVSLEPQSNSLFKSAGISKFLESEITCDIRDLAKLEKALIDTKPDVIIHMAAQSLVRESYADPITTFETNVNGTINVLQASQVISALKAQLIVTTDKVYKNTHKSLGYVETDSLGGNDPYSASKAMADIATQSWFNSFRNAPTAIVRAGNVIGGGDVCRDRLMPDLISSFSKGISPKLRAPNSIRPWQHVLDCLNGYLILVEHLTVNGQNGVWNFGPDKSQSKSVLDVANLAGSVWGFEKNWEVDNGIHPHESEKLLLNSEKARSQLGWHEKLNFEESVTWTVNWYKRVEEGIHPLEAMQSNIHDFELI